MVAVFTASEILDVTLGKVSRGVIGDKPGKLSWNLDEVGEGDWFVAMSSGSEDSHDSLSAAFELGAQGCIVNQRPRYWSNPKDGTLIAVADTKTALLKLAGYWRQVAVQKVVTVTGTVGRKETISFLEYLLQKEYRYHTAVERSELRCLPDILAMPRGTELLIAEVSGVNRGDIARLGSYLNPDLAIITTTHHPVPNKERDALVAALNCEILETIKESDKAMAVIFDRNPSVRERSKLMMKDLKTIYFSESSRTLSKSEVTWLTSNSGISSDEAQAEANAWCALTAAVCLGFSLEENPHIVSEVVVNAG